MTHPFLEHLRALANARQNADILPALAAFKDQALQTTLWIIGSQTPGPDGKVGLSLDMRELEGQEHPVLFAYLDEEQARQHAQGGEIMPLQFLAVGLIAQQGAMSLAIVHHDDFESLAHTQILGIRDMLFLDEQPASLGPEEARALMAGMQGMMDVWQRYCAAQPDVRSLHLAVVLPGGAPPHFYGILEASDAPRHLDALREQHACSAPPGYRLVLVDHLDLGSPEIAREVRKHPPLYSHIQPRGWWARLRRRFQKQTVPFVRLQVE